MEILQGANKFNLSSRCYKFKRISTKVLKEKNGKKLVEKDEEQELNKNFPMKSDEKNETPDSFSLEYKNFPFGRTQENSHFEEIEG